MCVIDQKCVQSYLRQCRARSEGQGRVKQSPLVLTVSDHRRKNTVHILTQTNAGCDHVARAGLSSPGQRLSACAYLPNLYMHFRASENTTPQVSG